MSQSETWLSGLLEVRRVLAAYQAGWAIAGGWALDLFLGRPTRAHADVDVAIWRVEQASLRPALSDWAFAVVQGGRLRPWAKDERLELPIHEIHATRKHGTDVLEFLLNERDESDWMYRRDPSIRRDMNAAIRWRERIPYLAPEIVLLYKSTAPRLTDEADFRAVAGALSSEQRAWLSGAIAVSSSSHPWRLALEAPPDVRWC
jgi:hypothetical protein